ncbi:MAG: hypothetical protein JWO04_5314, partial [Gammaproteobacteria bacterium]|nr:hypothetical protein [Gammaproteobacteria bacterium]
PDVVGVTAWEPIAAWLPLQAPLAVQEAAWVLDHISVADWPAVIEVGLTDMVPVGIGAGGAVDPLPPQACSARTMRAAAAAGQGSRIRKLVRIGDMLPRPSGVLRRKRPNTTQRRGVPTSMESCGGTLVPRVNSHTARLAPREFYSVTRSNFRDGLRRCAIHGGSGRLEFRGGQRPGGVLCWDWPRSPSSHAYTDRNRRDTANRVCEISCRKRS